MALIVEDGSIVAGANSYVSEAEFNAYLDNRGIIFNGVNGTAEQVLILAMDYIEGKDFIGEKNTKAQTTQWPRSGAYVDGFLIDDNEIPVDLKYAQIEVGIAIDAGNNPLSTLDRETKREKVGDIEVEYSDGARDSVELRSVNNRLAKLTTGGTGSGFVMLSRA